MASSGHPRAQKTPFRWTPAGSWPAFGEPLARAAQSGLRGLHVEPVQPQQVLAEDLAFRGVGQLRVAVAVAQVLRDLEVHERAQRPLRVEDRRLTAVDDLVLAAPEQQLPDDLREHPR